MKAMGLWVGVLLFIIIINLLFKKIIISCFLLYNCNLIETYTKQMKMIPLYHIVHYQ